MVSPYLQTSGFSRPRFPSHCLLHRWGGEEERGGKRGVSGEDSSDEEAEEKVSRAEELRRERLGTVVKRNLTGILLEVTDMLLGESRLPSRAMSEAVFSLRTLPPCH